MENAKDESSEPQRRVDPRARMQLYLTGLYSRHAHDEMLRLMPSPHPSELDDRSARISGERSARMRNLAANFGNEAPFLMAMLRVYSDPVSLITDFCDSAAFWETRALTLLENFCTYLQKAWKGEASDGIQDIAWVAGAWSRALFRAGSLPESAMDAQVQESRSVAFHETQTIVLLGSGASPQWKMPEPGRQLVRITLDYKRQTFVEIGE